MMLPSKVIVLLFAVALPTSTFSQPRFRGGLILGVSASQINGDNSAGYNKPGLVGGLRVVGRLKEKSEGSLELLFAQRGAQSEIIREQYNPFQFSLTLNYVEVPLQWHYKDWLIQGESPREDYYRVAFNLGLSYARYLGSRFRGESTGLEVVAREYLNKNDVALNVGFHYFFTRHTGLTLRYVRSLWPLYNPSDWNPAPYKDAWIGYCLYLQGVYLF